jgi:diguanylate cyclase (GGDEF)-like protein/PAS domain S-box-containing protein
MAPAEYAAERPALPPAGRPVHRRLGMLNRWPVQSRGLPPAIRRSVDRAQPVPFARPGKPGTVNARRTRRVGGSGRGPMDLPRQPPPDQDDALRRALSPEQGIVQAVDEHAIVAITDHRGRIIYANRRFCAISGYFEDELLGEDHRILNSGVHPRSYIRQMWATIGRGRVWHGEFCNRAKNGSLYWVQSTIVPLLGADGRPERYVSIRTDITHIKRIESALAASEGRFRRLFERSADALLLLDTEAECFIDCNQAAARMLGMSDRAELIGSSPADLSPPTQPDGSRSIEKASRMMDIALSQPSHRFEWVHCSPQRAPFPVEVLLTAITLDGQKLVMVTWRDITARRQAEQWRAHNTEVLSGLVEDSPTAALLDQVILFVQQQVPGLRLAVHALSHDGRVLAVSAPSLPEQLHRGVHDCPHAECRSQCRVLNPDAAQPMPDGRVCTPEDCPALAVGPGLWLGALDPIQGADGQLLGSVATFLERDDAPCVEERGPVARSLPLLALVIERARIREQRQLTEVVFRDSPEAIVLTDEQDRVQVANRAFGRLCGRESDTVIGHSLREFLSDRHDDAFHQAIHAEIAARGRWEGECWGQHRSGMPVPLQCSITAVVDHAGKPLHRIHVMTDLSDRKRQAEQIERLACFDALTQLPNRTMLQRQLQASLERAAATGRSLALLCIDLDRFKEVNDIRGHSTGDRTLVEVARRFRLRSGDQHMLARTGGDEFALIVEDPLPEQIGRLAGDLQQSLQLPLLIDDAAFTLGVSIGIASFPEDSHTAEDLLRQADIAMYRAKSSGGGYCFYREAMGEALSRQLDLAARLADALAGNQLQLHYQPLIDLSDGRLAGAEALLRWHDGDNGWIPPAEFIPVAEARGMMAGLGDWLFRLACRQVREWQDAGIEAPPRIAINLSAQQLGQADLFDRLRAALEEFGVGAERFELELTESSMVVDPEGAIALMTQLTALGFSLSIDDFGTGYSSLSYLKRFPARKLKIDISFVRDMLVDRSDHAIVETIIAMADTLGLETVAEGVETAAQADALAAMGCHCAQGFHFGPALAPAAFRSHWLQQVEKV